MPTIINADLDVLQIPRLYPDLATGMYSPRVVTLASGNVYKFTSSRVPPQNQMASPWWFDEVQFRKIQRYLDLDPNNWGFIARIQAAVKYQWNDMDTLVTARIMHPIKIFIGPGKWQLETTKAGGHISFQAPPDLLQMYIPGTVDPASRTLNAEGRKALHLVRSQRISSGDEIDRLIQTIPGKFVVLPANPTLH